MKKPFWDFFFSNYTLSKKISFKETATKIFDWYVYENLTKAKVLFANVYLKSVQFFSFNMQFLNYAAVPDYVAKEILKDRNLFF